RRIPTRHGSLSRPATSPSRTGYRAFDSSCATGTPSSRDAFAERFVRTIRQECLDHVLIYGRRHLERVLRTYVSHYSEERPHRGLDLIPPSGRPGIVRSGPAAHVRRRDILGGLIHEYRWAA